MGSELPRGRDGMQAGLRVQLTMSQKCYLSLWKENSGPNPEPRLGLWDCWDSVSPASSLGNIFLLL